MFVFLCAKALGEDQKSVILPQLAEENCEEYYQKARENTAKAESIDPDGIFASARKGGISGTAGAFATLYQACILRNKEIQQKEKAQ